MADIQCPNCSVLRDVAQAGPCPLCGFEGAKLKSLNPPPPGWNAACIAHLVPGVGLSVAGLMALAGSAGAYVGCGRDEMGLCSGLSGFGMIVGVIGILLGAAFLWHVAGLLRGNPRSREALRYLDGVGFVLGAFTAAMSVPHFEDEWPDVAWGAAAAVLFLVLFRFAKQPATQNPPLTHS